MKKVIMSMVLVGAMICSAATYEVYDFTLKAKTTAAKGELTTNCGESYFYRDKGNMTLKGVIAGCGCNTALANGSCDNYVFVLWNETTKRQITDIDTKTWVMQRIAKKATTVEHIADFGLSDGVLEYNFMLSGFGSYKPETTKSEAYVKSTSGTFAGYVTAPSYTKKGSCNACTSTPDETNITSALGICDCECEAAENAEVTPFGGTYTFKFNSNKSKKAAKNGVSNATLGLPSYVVLGE